MVVERVNFDTLAGVNFVSYFFPSGTYSYSAGQYLLQHAGDALERVKQNIGTILSHPVSDPEGIVAEDQPFSGRVFFYIEAYLEPTERSSLLQFADSVGVGLKIRDQTHADFLVAHEVPTAFISHDSRDKEELARPLAQKLTSMLCPVWYDEYSLRVGQSLTESIDAGIRLAKKCILLLSPNFLSNTSWSRAEFNAVVGKHINSAESVILPVWHGVSRQNVYDYSPMVADVKALDSAIGIDELARQLFLEIKPHLP